MKGYKPLSIFLGRVLVVLFMVYSLIGLSPQVIFAASTTSLTIRKMASDESTILDEKVVDYTWLMDPNNMPVLGDGITHYYHQGPVFVDHLDEKTQEMLRWNPEEDTNVETKDMGAVKGTNVKDLCELVGGMQEGDQINIKASDGLNRTFAYENVYQYSEREGPMAICWYKNGQYPDTGYRDGMRLIWFADDSTNPWGMHVFGNWDWHEAAEEQYWYFHHNQGQKYPTTTGLSIQKVSVLTILSSLPAPENSEIAEMPKEEPKIHECEDPEIVPNLKAPIASFTAQTTEGKAPLTVKFEDQSQNSPLSWSWDFDGDGKEDDTSQNPCYTYHEPGIYSVTLVVSNDGGNDERVEEDYIIVLPEVSLIDQESPEKSKFVPKSSIYAFVFVILTIIFAAIYFKTRQK